MKVWKKKFFWLMAVSSLVISIGLIRSVTANNNSSGLNSKVVLELKSPLQSSFNIVQRGNFDIVDMEGFALTSSPGEPMLPHKIHDILMPPNAIEGTVKLKILSSKKKILDGTYSIMAAGADVTRIDDQVIQAWGIGKVITNGKNINVTKTMPISPQKL
jgi:hypothetical protein